jgi:superfamily II DNA or RNA helicase
VLAQRLFVEKEAIPSEFLNQIQRLAAFQNPEFYKKQSLRLSTATTPRVIACSEDLPQHLVLPGGCIDALEQLLHDHGVSLILDDQREAGDELAADFLGQLTALQTKAAETLLQHETGVFVAPPGIGKTVLGTYLLAKRGRSTLVLIHRQPLLDQWIAQLAVLLGIEEKEVGQIGGGKRKPNGRLDVAMIPSLVRKGEVDDIVAGYGQVIVDECHHVPAVSFERVMAEVKARYVLGLTATPTRRDGHHPILEMQLGPVRFSVDPKNQAARRPFEHRLVVRETSFRPNGSTLGGGIQEIYRMLSVDEARNQLIVDDVIRALAEGRHPIVLTDHLDYFAGHLGRTVRHVVVLRGGRGAKDRREIAAALADIPPDEERVVLTTGRFAGEGFDDPWLDTLFLTAPVSWKGTIVQFAGHLHRLRAGKTEVRIYDYVDRQVPVLMRMFEKRLRAYRAIGYARDDALLGPAASEQLTIEYVPGALHHIHEKV